MRTKEEKENIVNPISGIAVIEKQTKIQLVKNLKIQFLNKFWRFLSFFNFTIEKNFNNRVKTNLTNSLRLSH